MRCPCSARPVIPGAQNSAASSGTARDERLSWLAGSGCFGREAHLPWCLPLATSGCEAHLPGRFLLAGFSCEARPSGRSPLASSGRFGRRCTRDLVSDGHRWRTTSSREPHLPGRPLWQRLIASIADAREIRSTMARNVRLLRPLPACDVLSLPVNRSFCRCLAGRFQMAVHFVGFFQLGSSSAFKTPVSTSSVPARRSNRRSLEKDTGEMNAWGCLRLLNRSKRRCLPACRSNRRSLEKGTGEMNA